MSWLSSLIGGGSNNDSAAAVSTQQQKQTSKTTTPTTNTTTTTNHDSKHSSTFTETTDANGTVRAAVQETMIVDNVTVQDCWDVITNVEGYPKFLPIYERVEILDRIDNSSSSSDSGATEDNKQLIHVAKYLIHVPYIFQAILREITYTLQLTLDSTNDSCRTMDWIGIGQQPTGVVANLGGWTMEANENGGVNLTMKMELAFTLYVPSRLKKWLLEHVLHDSLTTMKKRIEEQAALKNANK